MRAYIGDRVSYVYYSRSLRYLYYILEYYLDIQRK